LVLLVFIGLAGGRVTGTPSATGRTSQLTQSWQDRPETWLSARHAVAQRPLLGVGPGQFRTATSPFRPISAAHMEGPDGLFTDAHNLVVEYATTTGILGVSALILWLLAATRPGRGCLLAGALCLLAVHLFEPQSVVTTPLAFLALGASASHGVTRPRVDYRALHRIVTTLCVAGAVSAAAVLLAGDFQLSQAHLDLTLAPARQANRMLPAWPYPASLLARVWLFHGIVGRNPDDYRQSRLWRLVAVRRDDTDPGLWNDLAELDESNGLTGDADAEYRSALRFNPTSARAINGLARLAHGRCDLAQERYWTQRALLVSPRPGGSASLPGTGVLQLPAPVCPKR
jgi:hypothetical protein